LFEREWARILISRVTASVRAALRREGRVEDFDRLSQFLPGNDDPVAYSDVARRLGQSESALKVAVHRLRRRYREMFRAEMAHLVSDASQIDDEIRRLLAMIRP
jgi:RNA polymerase sigma-70 factor (ECF subfamily)